MSESAGNQVARTNPQVTTTQSSPETHIAAEAIVRSDLLLF